MIRVLRKRPWPLKNQKGEVYYEIIIKTLIVVVTLLTVISFYNVFTKYQNNNYLCRRIVREIELEGAVSSQVDIVFNQLKTELNLTNASYTVSKVSYFDYPSKRIQLRDNFTVTVESICYIEIFNPVFAPTVKIPLTLKSTLTGMSEVYHKPGGV